jgi:uncharacterized integral membrane protein
MKVKFILLFALLILVVIFTLQNTAMVDINFIFWHFSISRALLIFVVLGAGILAGLLIGGVSRKKPKE